jgi:hypothetical protein
VAKRLFYHVCLTHSRCPGSLVSQQPRRMVTDHGVNVLSVRSRTTRSSKGKASTFIPSFCPFFPLDPNVQIDRFLFSFSTLHHPSTPPPPPPPLSYQHPSRALTQSPFHLHP